MTNPLFDLLVTFKSVKISWEKLEAKYMELTTLERRNMWSVNDCTFILLMTSHHGTGLCLWEPVFRCSGWEHKDVRDFAS